MSNSHISVWSGILIVHATWLIKFYCGIYQDWKVLEQGYWSWKVLKYIKLKAKI